MTAPQIEWAAALTDEELELTLQRTLEVARKPVANPLDMANLKVVLDLLVDEKARRMTR